VPDAHWDRAINPPFHDIRPQRDRNRVPAARLANGQRSRTTSMQNLFSLPAALAFGALGVTLFALIRRLMRADHPPAILSTDVAAYAVALLLTGYFAMSLIATSMALLPIIGSVTKSAVAAAVLHIGYWVLARLIIPIRGEPIADVIMPPAAPAA
jgi:hypothetical protein